MRNSTRQLSQISLVLLLLLKSSLVLSARPEVSVSLTPLDESFSSERFLQRNNNNNNNNNSNNQYACQSGKWCTLRGSASVQYTIVMSSNSYLTSMIMLSNQPETALTIAYTSTSSASNITTELSVSGYGQPSLIIDTPSTNSFNAVVPQATIQDYEDGAVYFSVDNGSPSTTTVTITMTFASASTSSSGSNSSSSLSSESQTTSDPSVSLIYIILPIVGMLLIIFVLGICCHYRKKRYEQERAARAMRGRRRVRGAARGGDQQAGEEEEGEEYEDPLTEQNITERFPEGKFDSLKSSFPQTTCSVCLEEFQKGAACRQLYCEHMFHSDCIRLWLTNQLKKGHAFCPNCNKNMMNKPSEEAQQPEAARAATIVEVQA